MYKIPRDPIVARKWLDACGFEHLAVSPSTVTFKVCREHFTSDDFEGPATLRADAVPSLFTTHSRSLMEKQNSSPNKRFRPDSNNIRPKSTMPNKQQQQQRQIQLPYRTTNIYQRSQESTLSSPPMEENFDETSKQTLIDLDLILNCFEEQLSESQMAHCPVKVNPLFRSLIPIVILFRLSIEWIIPMVCRRNHVIP